ncbi:MAG: GTP-binding protein [Anaerolineae bacterium]|nr:GTP-binding protein [Anaerolineae bacterium]
MVQRILTEDEEALLVGERRRLNDLRIALSKLDLSADDQETLENSVNQLDELFLLVVVGEFNSGKSAVINALLGQRLLEEGVTPTTTRIQLIRYGEDFRRSASDDGLGEVALPAPLLRVINIVDTPGTNAVYRQHEALTQDFVPRSDIVLFVTSVDRPFTESERLFLEVIRDWGKKIVFVVNKIDILESPEEVDRIEAFVADHARRLLGLDPEVFPVSARLALRAKASGDAQALEDSRFRALEEYVVATLDEKERIRLKLRNPLGVGRHLAQKYLQVTESRLGLLQSDIAAIDEIGRQLGIYKQDMTREFQHRLAEVDNALHALENRGVQFFDETVRLGRVFDLMNKAMIRSEFERKVVGDTPRLLEERVNDIIDWLVAGNLRQWQAITDYLAQRRLQYADRIIGQMGGGFDYDRSRLLDTVGRAAQQVVHNYDQRSEAKRIADAAQGAVAGTALAEIGAIGLGAAVALLATSTMADVTGVAAASMVAVLGLFIIPARRSQAKSRLRSRIGAMREDLTRALTHEFDQALDRDLRRIGEAISPYTRFVRAERARLIGARRELTLILRSLTQLAARVEDL